MTVNVTSPITGSAQTGFTSPTYTLTAMAAPDVNAKQNAVTALGGTQTGATSHSVQSPFTLAFWYPKVLRTLNFVLGSTTQPEVPKNVYKWITRKGVTVHASLPIVTALVTTTVEVPAGADTVDPANLRAMLSAHVGGLNQFSAGLGDTAASGVA
jgi:hypothetical protein